MKLITTKIFYSLIALVVLFGSGLKAQQVTDKITVRGKIIDILDKKGITGAHVIERDKDMRYISGVATDIDGNFAIKIADPANLISFSFMGYKTVILPIKERSVFNIEL